MKRNGCRGKRIITGWSFKNGCNNKTHFGTAMNKHRRAAVKMVRRTFSAAITKIGKFAVSSGRSILF
jgi:hypothetical protein